MTPQNPIDDDRLAALPVQDGLDALLRELVHEHAPVAPGEPTTRRRWPLVVAAAASVAAVVTASAILGQGRVPEPASPTAPTSSAAASPSPKPTQVTVAPDMLPAKPRVGGMKWTGPTSYAVLDAPGWVVEADSVSTTRSYSVELTYVQGGQRLTLSWVREKWFGGLVRDAERETTARSLDVLGEAATYVTYESQQQMAFLPVHDGFGLRVDGAFTTPATFEALVGDLRVTDEKGLSAALPEGTVTPATAPAVTDQMLRDSRAPDGTIVQPPPGYNARYHAAADVVGTIGCAWIQQWVDGDAEERAEAEDALAGSRTWAPITEDLRQPGWFEITVRMMRRGAPDDQVLGSAGCHVPGSPTGDNLVDALEDPQAP